MIRVVKSPITIGLIILVLVLASAVGFLANRPSGQITITKTETVTLTFGGTISTIIITLLRPASTVTVTKTVQVVSPSSATATEEVKTTMEGVRELILLKAGATHYELRLMPSGKKLLYLEPSEWQGNSDVYSVTGEKRVGHHWSHWGIDKFLSPIFRKLLSLEEYNMLFSKIIEVEREIEKQLEFFYSAAASQPKARVLYDFGPDGYEAIYLYPIEKGNERIKIELNYTEFIQELGLERYELIPQPPHHFIKRPTFPLAKLLPYRLTLSQCFERLLHHFNQIMLTEEELERLGIQLYQDRFGIYFDRSGWEKIFQLKEKRKLYMSIQRPRNETVNKILNLTRLIYLSKESLKKYIKVKPIII